ncbi:MAG: AGE family epimerase/isomerase [Kiritimatiellae bacterium]|nr:AGE family epimerase/isomerase [Kiritimatiellia bacterium]
MNMKIDLSMLPTGRLEQLREQYRASLFDDVVPWWEKHSLDRECGGYYSLLERDGHVWATDKYMWMTGREIWMFSHLYNHHKNNPAWLDAARLGADFILKHGFVPDGGGKMYFRLARDGRPRSKVLSLYTELFAVIGIAELSKAAGDESLWTRAMAMYDFLVPRFGQPEDTAQLGYPIEAQFHMQAHDMCRITAAWALNEIRPSQRFEDDLSVSVESMVNWHWKPELSALLEHVAMDGAPMLDLPEGRMVIPGHAIESAWMLLEVARKRGDELLVRTAVDIVLASLERGWDREYGGLIYIANIDGTPCHPLCPNLKLWWTHCETLYALLLGYALTGRRELWTWYERVHEYTFNRFPDPQYGEWLGYLDRDGKPMWTAKANGWKGFFHLPRVLFRCHQLLQT